MCGVVVPAAARCAAVSTSCKLAHMLMLLPSAVGRVSTSVVLSGGGGSLASTLTGRITQGGVGEEGSSRSAVLSSPVLESWDGLKDVSSTVSCCDRLETTAVPVQRYFVLRCYAYVVRIISHDQILF